MPHGDTDNPLAREVHEDIERQKRQAQAEREGTALEPAEITPAGRAGDVEFGQIDPRTDFMRMLEMASAPALFNALLNPGGAAGMLGGTPLGQGGGGPGTGLLQTLLGPGAMSGAAPAGGMVPGAGAIGGAGQDPLTALLQGAFGGQLGQPGGGGGSLGPATAGAVGGGAIDWAQLLQGGAQGEDVNFLQQGGELQPDALNIVGEAGPEAVVGDQVVPLGQLQQITNSPLGQQQGLTISQQGGQPVLGQQVGPAGQGSFQQVDPSQFAGAGSGLNMDAVNAITGVQPSEQAAPSGGAATNPQTDITISPGGPGGPAAGGGGGNQPDQAPVGGQQTQFNSGNQGAQGGGVIGRLLEQNPEQQAFGTAQDLLTGEGGLLNREPGAGVMGALEPIFQRNLQSGLNELTNRVPSVHSSGAAAAGTDLTRQALQDFNLMGAQAAQQGIGQQLQGLQTLGGLAGPAGQNPFQRALGAGQFGLAAQNQAFQQQIGPAMQLLMAAFQQGTPTGQQTVGGPFQG